MLFDIALVRLKGKIIPRHNVGLIRVARGRLEVSDMHVPNLRRHVRVGKFHPIEGSMLELFDAVLVYATTGMWVMNGFERDFDGITTVDYAQTWILTEPSGAQPEATRGPAYLG